MMSRRKVKHKFDEAKQQQVADMMMEVFRNYFPYTYTSMITIGSMRCGKPERICFNCILSHFASCGLDLNLMKVKNGSQKKDHFRIHITLITGATVVRTHKFRSEANAVVTAFYDMADIFDKRHTE
jgi:hypothetical protein